VTTAGDFRSKRTSVIFGDYAGFLTLFGKKVTKRDKKVTFL